jgi:hypothetical protein
MSDAEAKRQRNRELMPNVAALVDEWKEQFPDLKVIWAKDLVTGHEVGKKEEPDPSKVFVIPPNYFPTASRETPKKGRKR